MLDLQRTLIFSSNSCLLVWCCGVCSGGLGGGGSTERSQAPGRGRRAQGTPQEAAVQGIHDIHNASAVQGPCSTNSNVLPPCVWLALVKRYLSLTLCVVCLCMMMTGGCNTAGCTLLIVCAALQARPVPTYGTPFLPSLSGSKLTEAKSPAFCTRSRDR